MSGASKETHLFNKPDADIVLRSANGVEFPVHKAVLSAASPVFESMFTLPQPSSNASPTSTADSSDLPVVDVSESSEVLNWLLRLCYPRADDPAPPAPPQLRDIARIIQTARKYDMQEALTRAAKMLTPPGALDDPLHALRVYAVASDVDVPQAEEAARASLRAPLGKDLPYELDSISPASLYRLLDYRRRVHVAAVRYLTDTTKWALTEDFNLDPENWGFSEPLQDPEAIVFSIAMCRCEEHSGSLEAEADPYLAYCDVLQHLRIDRTWVIYELVEQVEQINGAFEVSMPNELLQEAGDLLECGECFREAEEYLEGFSVSLQDGVKKIMMEVPLDDL